MYSRKVHIFTATDDEYNMVLNVMKSLQLKAALYKLQLKDVKLHKTGVGPIDTMKYIVKNGRQFRNGDVVLNIGLAGFNGKPEDRIYQIKYSHSLDEDLRPLGGENFYHICELPTFHIPTHAGVCYSSASFVTKELAKFRDLPKGSICDMELQTICQLMSGQKVYSVKYISDTLDGGEYDDNLEQIITNFQGWLEVNLPHILRDISAQI